MYVVYAGGWRLESRSPTSSIDAKNGGLHIQKSKLPSWLDNTPVSDMHHVKACYGIAAHMDQGDGERDRREIDIDQPCGLECVHATTGHVVGNELGQQNEQVKGQIILRNDWVVGIR